VETSIYLLLVLIEYVLLVSTAAPFILVNRFSKNPNFGIAIWFLLFFSAMAASLTAVGIAAWSIIETYYLLQTATNIWLILAASVAPWLMLAFAGILLALSNQKLEPLFRAAKQFDQLAQLARREVESFHKAKVYELEIPGFIALTQGYAIYLSKTAFDLPEKQLNAVLWHEYGHIRLRHQRLKRFTSLMLQLSPWFVVSRGFSSEVARLCEIAADKYAMKRVYSKDLAVARSHFL
jgi:Zn-dependent protease with chaperone function